MIPNLSLEAVASVVNNSELAQAYRGRRVLVLGADGFLGSYLSLSLLRLGAHLSIVSRRDRPLLEGMGATVHRGDLCSTKIIEQALLGQELVFDMAGASGGIDSNRNAAENLAIESAPHLKLFEAASRLIVPPLIVFCSTRTVYGKPLRLPVDETHPTDPCSIYAVHKLTLERYLQIFNSLHGLRYVIFRLSNPYGPFPWQEGKSYGVLNQFISRALKGETLTLFGDGEQLRDYIFIEDVVGVVLLAAADSRAKQTIFNLGGPSAISMRDALGEIVAATPGSRVVSKAWPTDYKAVETGSYVSDTGLLEKRLGWQPKVTFSEGLRRTLLAYRTGRTNAGSSVDRWRVGANYWQGRRVLVTGAGGSLGSFMSGVLSKLGARVTALYRSRIPHSLFDCSNVSVIQADLTSGDARLEEIFAEARPEVVYHFAASPDGEEGSERILERIRSNTIGMNRLLEASRLYKTDAFLIADSCKVYGNAPVPHKESSAICPESSYAVTKYAAWVIAEIYGRNFDLPVACLRPTLVYGPGQAFNVFSFLVRCLQEKKSSIQLSGGNQTRDPLFITDAIRAYLLAAQNIAAVKGRALPIGGGHEASVLELSRRFVAQAGGDVPVEACAGATRLGEIFRSYCGNEEARELLGWSPQVGLDAGFDRLARYLLADDGGKIAAVDALQQQLVDELLCPALSAGRSATMASIG